MSSVAGLSRLPCATCGSDTLHKGATCVHCWSVHAPDLERREQMERMELAVTLRLQRKGGPGKKKRVKE